MDRETKTIETPISKQSVVLYTFLLGREKRALTNVFLGKSLNISLDSQNVTGIDSAVIEQAQELGWKTVVVSIDGSKENIVETILNMRSEDYDFVVAAVNELTSQKKS